MKILIIKPSSLGDIIHAMRVIVQLKHLKSEVEIHWVIKKGLEGIIEASDLVKKVYLFKRGAGLFEFVRLIREIRQEEFDFIFDMQGLLRSAIITFGAKGSYKVGRADGREGSVFFYKPIGEKSRKKKIHAIERLLPFFNEVGIENYNRSLPLTFPSSKEVDLENLGINKSFILLFPESRRKEKQWPYFLNLLDEIRDRLEIQVVVAGNEKLNHSGDFIDLGGQLTINKLPSLILAASVVVTNDSAPLHLASALNTKLVGLFGPTSSSNYGPFPQSQNSSFTLQSKTNEMKDISVDDVLLAIRKLLQ